MALTVTNVNSLTLLNILNRTSAEQSNTLTRLSTGTRLNRGQDDPAGLIALKSLESELTSVNAAITNNQRTDAMLTVADNALGELGSLLDEVQKLAAASTNAGGLSPAEIAANQAQIDNAIASIDRIVRTTSFNGMKLLDGSLGINATGVDSTNITDVRVYSRNPSAESATIRVQVNTVATRATADGTSRLVANSASEDTTIEIRGALGSQVIEILKDENLSSITAKINDATALTGVVASQTGGLATGAINLYSQGYGSDEFVKVSLLEGGSANGGTANDFKEVNVDGTDADVFVNGMRASADGREVFFNQNGLSLSFKITGDFAAGSTDTFTVDDDGGATFQLGTDASTRATFGINGLYSQQLGTGTVGETLASLRSGATNSLLNDPCKAAEIAGAAAGQVAQLQSRLGGFLKYQVQTSTNSMNTVKESLTAARGLIADTDYAVESAELNRQNVLMQSAIALLGLANQQSAQVLSLLM